MVILCSPDCPHKYLRIRREYCHIKIVSQYRFRMDHGKRTCHFTMNVFNHGLVTVEATSFRILNFIRKAHIQIFVDYAVRCCKTFTSCVNIAENLSQRTRKKSENVTDEVAFVVVEFILPIVHVFCEIHFLSGPKRSFGLLVKLPYVRVLNGKKDKALRVRSEERFLHSGRFYSGRLYSGRFDGVAFDSSGKRLRCSRIDGVGHVGHADEVVVDLL